MFRVRALGVLLLLALFSLEDCAQTQRPHIVFILADDLGWDDISLHGSAEIPTPNIDQLATDGIVLNNYYVQQLCTPSRAALLTGRHPIHLGLQHNVIVTAQPYGLGLNETLLPQYLKSLGYRTHVVGKWHLGFFAEEYTPTFRGFDSHFGYYQGCEDYYDHTYGVSQETWGLDFWRDKEVERAEFGQYSTEIFTSEAEKIIAEHDDSDPLFLYIPQQAVHSGNPKNPTRLQAPWKYVQKFLNMRSSERRLFAGMVSALDDSVGNITKALHNKGILNNTILIFSTDNGGPANRQDYNDACNWPLRGSKRTMWEGGVRGNGFIWSPLLKTSHYVSEHLMQVTDWLPTLLEAAGYDMAKLPKNIDGVSQWKALSQHSESPRRELFHNFDPVGTDGALRFGDFKVVFGAGDTKRYSGWFAPEQLSARGPSQRSSLPDVGKVSPAKTIVRYQNPSVRSDLTRVLESLGRKQSPETVQIVVKCGPMPINASSSCMPWIKPCLFNVTMDPCEYHNLADSHREILEHMMARVQEHKATAVPIRNKPDDPRGYPIHFGGIWRPWVKL